MATIQESHSHYFPKNRKVFCVELTVDQRWMVLIDGVQQGGDYDDSGAGNLTFATKEEARVFGFTL